MTEIALSRRTVLKSLAGAAAAVAFSGCGSSGPGELVLYTSVDQPIATKVIGAFEKANAGASVRLVTDTEALKSVGLAEKLRAEKANPACHVWWGNEVFHTITLANEGHFESLSGDELNAIKPQFKDAQLRWAGCGLRARMLAVGEKLGETVGPIEGSVFDLIDPRFKGRVALARPLAGTTAGHVSALYALWGDTKADDYFKRLKANGAVLLGGNGEVAQQVGNGNLALGLTDNDDIFNVQRTGGELWQVVPDQKTQGTLVIPTTVALVKRSDPHPLAQKLVAHLLADATERLLLDEHFAAYSVRESPDTLRPMNLSYDAIAAQMSKAPKRVADIFDGRA